MSEDATLGSYERSESLDAASELRLPVFQPGTMRDTKCDVIGDYILENGALKGDLCRERLATYEALAPLEEEWEGLEGWEDFRVGRTDKSIDEAKKVLRGDLYHAIRVLGWRVKRLGEEIERLDEDYARASRYYSTLSGS